MKKLMAIYSLLLFGITSAQSIKYGVTGNFHKSSIGGIHDRSKAIFGGNVGVFADFSLVTNDIYDSAWLYFTPQLEFAMQGENAKHPGKDTQKYHNYYIGLPLYIKYYLKNSGYKSDIFFFGGPRLEFLVSEKRSGPAQPQNADELEEKINKLGYGLSVGLGVRVQDNIEVFLRYDRGFSKIYPDFTKYATFNQMLGLGVSYYIGEN